MEPGACRAGALGRMDDAVGMRRTTRQRSREAGVALLISLFALLLICVVGVALIMASGTESALTGNYRSATTAYYAALAGLEEGRGRMMVSSPNYLPTFAWGLPRGTVPTVGPGATAQVWYITNPAPGEPPGSALLQIYKDTEYATEFTDITAPVYSYAPSTLPPSGPQGTIYNPPYKWVRINAITITSAQNSGVNVDHNQGSEFTPLTYVNNTLTVDQPGLEALEITSLAVMPNGSQRMLQYIIGPTALNLTSFQGGSFPSALTLDGNGVSFTGPTAAQYAANGNQFTLTGNDIQVGGCAPSVSPVNGIGFTNGADQANLMANINAEGVPNVYQGSGPPPSVNLLANGALPPNWQTPSGLTNIVQTIAANADANVTPVNGTAATHDDFPASMSPTNPVTIVVNGDLTIQNWAQTGYGMLVVTGTLNIGPNDSWKGIVLVIGQGNLIATQGGSGQFQGAVLVARTVDSNGNLLKDSVGLGPATVSLTGGGNGVTYSSCWVAASQGVFKYKTLSFREITPPTP
jgi:hypothetical protein